MDERRRHRRPGRHADRARDGGDPPADRRPRSLTPGDKLPSIRALRRNHAGLDNPPSSKPMIGSPPKASIRSRPGSGFYVAGAACRRWRWPRSGPALDRDVDPFWVSRQSLDAGDTDAEARLRLAAGRLDAEGGDAPRHSARLARADDARSDRLRHARAACRPAPAARPAARRATASRPRPTRSC